MNTEDKIAHIEQLCNFKLYDFQKQMLRIFIENPNKTIHMNYPYRSGRTMTYKFLQKYEETFRKG